MKLLNQETPKPGGDERGENLQIRIGVSDQGRIGFEFSHPVISLRMERDRARTLAQRILKLLDDSDSIVTKGSN